MQFKNDKIFIYQEKVLGMEGQVFENWAVKETRIHVFRTDEGVKPKVTSVPKGTYCTSPDARASCRYQHRCGLIY